MITAVRFLSSHIDQEYQQIIQELLRLGISPSGNKIVDKQKLQQAKAELVQKIQDKKVEEQKESIKVEIIAPAENVDNSEKSSLELQRLGAMTVAELNRLYFGI